MTRSIGATLCFKHVDPSDGGGEGGGGGPAKAREDAGLDGSRKRKRIRCPKCAWEPSSHDEWGCTCGHIWNTFDTGGVCPACDKQWAVTQCLAEGCRVFSAHRAWYEGEDEG